MTALVVVIAVLVLLALGGVLVYNRLVRLRNLVEESWRQVDVELQRRHDLVGNLVETVKGYAGHERETLEAVTRARAAATSPDLSRAELAQAENALTGALRQLLAVSEAYPELKADALFQQLQGELTETEDRVAGSRRYYNANVRSYNTAVESVPTNLVAGPFGFQRADYFEVEDAGRQAPRVDFGRGTPTVSPPAQAPQARPPAQAPQAPPPAQAPPAVEPGGDTRPLPPTTT